MMNITVTDFSFMAIVLNVQPSIVNVGGGSTVLTNSSTLARVAYLGFSQKMLKAISLVRKRVLCMV